MGNAFNKWSRIAKEAKQLGYNISVSTMLEDMCTDEEKAKGYDLGDYLIDRILKLKQVTENRTTETQTDIQEDAVLQNVTDNHSDTLNGFIELNPAVKSLIDGFELVEVLH